MAKYKCTNETCEEKFTDFKDCNGHTCNRCDDGQIEQVDTDDDLGMDYYDYEDDDLEDWED